MRWCVPLFLLVACGSDTLSVSSSQPACEAEDAEESFTVTRSDEETIVAIHAGVTQACSASFQPEVTSADGIILIREYWVEGAQSSCTTCFQPTVEVAAITAREVEVHWLIGDADLPDHVAEVEMR